MLRQAQHERIWVERLISHPAQPPVAVTGIEAMFAENALTFTVSGALPLIPAPAAPIRTEGLWKTTCFELFVMPVGQPAYFEFNFSPSTAWAAYRFSGYREGMADLPLKAPVIEAIEDGIRVAVDLSDLPPPPWRVALTAVIEETDGTKSYWALAHPDGPPDFHDPACFVLELPAAG